MNGHWLSTTRKLNKHYQSGSRFTPAPLWGDCFLFNIGCSYGTYCYLTLRSDGIYPHNNAGSSGQGLYIPQGHILANEGFTNILPLVMYDLNGITLNNEDFSNLGVLNDPSGKLHTKYDTVNIEMDLYGYGLMRYSKRMLIIYINVVDVPLRNDGITTKETYFFNVKWNKPFRVPLTQPIDLSVDKTGFYCYYNTNPPAFVCDARLNATRRFFYDSINSSSEYYPPNPNSYIEFTQSFNVPRGDATQFTSPFGTVALTVPPGAITATPLARSGSFNAPAGMRTADFDNGYCLWSSGGMQTDPVPQGCSIRIYTNDFDTTQYRYHLSGGSISGTGNTFTRTTVTGWH